MNYPKDNPHKVTSGIDYHQAYHIKGKSDLNCPYCEDEYQTMLDELNDRSGYEELFGKLDDDMGEL